MSYIEFEGANLDYHDGESILDCLLREGKAIPHGCRAGHCQSCLLVSDEASPPSIAQLGLTPAMKQRGEFLSCQCPAQNKMKIRRLRSEEKWRRCAIQRLDLLSADILRIRVDNRQYWQAGQFFTLSLDGEQSRCFSAANSAQLHPYTEFHLRLHQDGAVTGPLLNLVSEQQPSSSNESSGGFRQAAVFLGPPMGDCVFEARQDGPLLLIARGTGLAPTQAIAQQALLEIPGIAVTLYGFGRSADQNYWRTVTEGITASSTANEDQFSSHFWDDNTAPANDPIADFVSKHRRDLRNIQIFIFGSDRFVATIHKHCVQAGLMQRQIKTEAFLDCGQI